jgi:hypothetical protein
LKTPTFSISKRGVLVSARIRGSLTFFGSYAKFSVVGLTNVVVDYGTLNLLLLLFPTRDHNPQPRLVKRVFEMEYWFYRERRIKREIDVSLLQLVGRVQWISVHIAPGSLSALSD